MAARSDFIKFLEIAAKTLSMYQESHPRTQQGIEKIVAMMHEALQGKESITISESEGNLLLDGEVVTRDLQIDSLAKNMLARSVHSLTFQRAVTREELTGLLRNFNLKPGKLVELGGLSKILHDSGIKNIQINKVKYGIIGEEGALDQSFLSELLSTVQSIVGGNSDSGSAAVSLEKSLENSATQDPGAMLFRVFQMMPQRDTPVEGASQTQVVERFNQLFQSFTPAMQGNLLFSALLKDIQGRDSLYGFYRNLTAAELEPAILSLLDKPLSPDEMKEFVAKLSSQNSLLTAAVRSKLVEMGLLPPDANEGSAVSPVALLMATEVLSPEDIETTPQALSELLAVENIQDADRLSKKIFGYLTAGTPDQKLASIKVIPEIARILSAREKWKSVEVSLSFLISTCFRKETNDAVASAFLSLVLRIFWKNYEAGNTSGCQEILGTLRSQLSKNEKLKTETTGHLSEYIPMFVKEIHNPSPRLELMFEFLRLCGEAGAEVLVDLLTEEEDQAGRSRVIQQICAFQPEQLFPVLQRRLSDSRWYVARNMVTILGKMNAPDIPEFFSAAAVHPDSRVPKELIKLMYKTNFRSTSLLILPLLSHADRVVRMQAVHLAATQHLESSVPELLKLAAGGTLADTDIRTAAFQALLKLRSMESVPFAAALLDRKSASKMELAERNAAVRILGEMDRDRSQNLLQKVAQSDPNAETRVLASSFLLRRS